VSCLRVLIRTTKMWAVCLVWAGDVAEEEPEEEDDQLGNLDEEEIKKMQSDEVLFLSLFLFCFVFCFCFILASSFLWRLTVLKGD